MHLRVGRGPVAGRGRRRGRGGKIRSPENGEMLSFLASPLYSKMLEMKHIFFTIRMNFLSKAYICFSFKKTFFQQHQRE